MITIDPQAPTVGLDTLLDLNGTRYYVQKYYVVRFSAKQIEPTPAIPHGISYNLTLHYKDRERILGYDNRDSYRPKASKGKFRGRRIVRDHKHKYNQVYLYEFVDAAQLIEDFWKDVYKIIGKGEPND